MSLRNRARQLQRATGMTYQQAIARLRALGTRPVELSRTTGWPLAKCDLYLARPKIEVIDARDPIERICGDLLESTNARSVRLFDAYARTVAHDGEPDLTAGWFSRFRGRSGWLPVREMVAETEDAQALLAPIGQRGVLVVVFDEGSSLELIRARIRWVKDELEQLLPQPEPGRQPPPARGGRGGTPAHAWESVEIFKKRRK